ncbi:acyl transferase/acyl hydrolase/lysophospholipase [Delphinella strobiligena]|nr:acyl transferase/acyl hydrolase/lysophospholipase [Delphinella strobiligena]
MASNQATARCGCPEFLKESVLTLDGGGIRGYASLLILHELMKAILEIEHELDDKLDQTPNDIDTSSSHHQDNQLPLPCHYFNYVFGTSTGGIIALLLGRMRLSIEQCLSIYRDMGTEIFRKKRMLGLKFDQYSHEKMEKLIKKAIREHSKTPATPGNIEAEQHMDSSQQAQRDRTGMQSPRRDQVGASNKTEKDEEELNELENLSLYDLTNRLSKMKTENAGLEKCRVGLIATRRGEESHRPHLFRSYRNPTQPGEISEVQVLNLDRQDDGERKIKIWEAARATSAAPHYFKRIKIDFTEYMDGGLVANNPTWHAWYEVSSMHTDNPWGCGAQQGCIRFLVSLGTGKGAPTNLFSDGNMFHQILKIFGSAMDELTNPEGVDVTMRNMVNQFLPGADIYTRFNVPKALQNMKLDECEKKGRTFNKISKAVNVYLRSENGAARNQLNALARQLVEHRRSKCRAQHQRYEGLSTPGPIDATFSNRFPNLNDIEIILQNRSNASGSPLPTSMEIRL